jgi:hypothetical protein
MNAKLLNSLRKNTGSGLQAIMRCFAKLETATVETSEESREGSHIFFGLLPATTPRSEESAFRNQIGFFDCGV